MLARMGQAIRAVARQVHHEAGFGQALVQVVARLGFVLDNQDTHDSITFRAAPAPPWRNASRG
jgi:hypothetical protein